MICFIPCKIFKHRYYIALYVLRKNIHIYVLPNNLEIRTVNCIFRHLLDSTPSGTIGILWLIIICLEIIIDCWQSRHTNFEYRLCRTSRGTSYMYISQGHNYPIYILYYNYTKLSTRNTNPILSSFMTFHRVCNKTSATCWAGTASLPEHMGSCPVFSGVLAKIGYGNLCMREKNLNLNNNNMISELLVCCLLLCALRFQICQKEVVCDYCKILTNSQNWIEFTSIRSLITGVPLITVRSWPQPSAFWIYM
jgi:hypothetical protein